MTEDEADFQLMLTTANDPAARFAMKVGQRLDPDMKGAFERGIRHDWFTLVDLTTLSAHPEAELYRIFKLTVRGRARLAWLQQHQGDRNASMR